MLQHRDSKLNGQNLHLQPELLLKWHCYFLLVITKTMSQWQKNRTNELYIYPIKFKKRNSFSSVTNLTPLTSQHSFSVLGFWLTDRSDFPRTMVTLQYIR